LVPVRRQPLHNALSNLILRGRRRFFQNQARVLALEEFDHWQGLALIGVKAMPDNFLTVIQSLDQFVPTLVTLPSGPGRFRIKVVKRSQPSHSSKKNGVSLGFCEAFGVRWDDVL
jgi:hypothetical protein